MKSLVILGLLALVVLGKSGIDCPEGCQTCDDKNNCLVCGLGKSSYKGESESLNCKEKQVDLGKNCLFSTSNVECTHCRLGYGPVVN